MQETIPNPQQRSMPSVWVFKTNIQFKKDVKHVEAVLNQTPGVMCWHVDRQDADKVLRVESPFLQPEQIIALIKQAGYCCEELPD